MKKACEQYRKQIELYQSGLLEDKQEIAWLLEHLHDCPTCAALLEEYQKQERDLDRWVDSLDSVIAAGQEQSIEALRGLAAEPSAIETSTPLKFLQNYWIRNAAAAAVFIIAGFLAGRLSKPAVSPEQLVASLQPAIQEQVVPAVLDQLRPELAQGFTQLRENMSAEMTDQFQTCARETLVASNYQTNQRLQELIDAIAKAQVQERQWMYSALDQIERNRIQDQLQMQEGLAAFAALTGDELARTQQRIDSLMVPAAEN